MKGNHSRCFDLSLVDIDHLIGQTEPHNGLLTLVGIRKPKIQPQTAVLIYCRPILDIYRYFFQDLAILAKHLPNISVAGYWWHTFYPFYIRKSLETRLDIVPSNKIIGFFSDAYHSEWCYPKLKLVKHILGDILIERVERGWYTLAVALDIINKLLYENAVRIYRL